MRACEDLCKITEWLPRRRGLQEGSGLRVGDVQRYLFPMLSLHMNEVVTAAISFWSMKGVTAVVEGASWIELNGTFHQFIAGDRSHLQTNEIYMMVEEACQRVSSSGHVSGTTEVLFDIEEEEKEHSLFLHSEKLAVAFGLISTAQGSPIRITKNLRFCTDCHYFLKAVFQVFGRERVARDRN